MYRLILRFLIMVTTTRGVSGPWLLFISESGHGKRVPLSSFRKLPLNRVGLIGYKVILYTRFDIFSL